MGEQKGIMDATYIIIAKIKAKQTLNSAEKTFEHPPNYMFCFAGSLVGSFQPLPQM